jgi:hypothetical protein
VRTYRHGVLAATFLAESASSADGSQGDGEDHVDRAARIARFRGDETRAAELLDDAIETVEAAGEQHTAFQPWIERCALAPQRGPSNRTASGCVLEPV